MSYTNKEREYGRRYYLLNKKKVKACSLKWHKKNPERVKELQRKWYKNHRDKCIQWSKEWQKKNPERVKELHHKWNKNHVHSEKDRVRDRLYYKTHPESNYKLYLAYQQKHILKLSDSYIKRLFIRNSILQGKDVPVSLIKVRRNQVKIRRIEREIRRNMVEK